MLLQATTKVDVKSALVRLLGGEGEVVRVEPGKIGFLGAAAVARQALAPAASDPATCITLVNSLRTALINLGLGQ
jgi:hypothetical protein